MWKRRESNKPPPHTLFSPHISHKFFFLRKCYVRLCRCVCVALTCMQAAWSRCHFSLRVREGNFHIQNCVRDCERERVSERRVKNYERKKSDMSVKCFNKKSLYIRNIWRRFVVFVLKWKIHVYIQNIEARLEREKKGSLTAQYFLKFFF